MKARVCCGSDNARASQARENCSLHIAYIFLMRPDWEMAGNKIKGEWTDCPQSQALGVPCVPGSEGKGILVGIHCRGSCCHHGRKQPSWSCLYISGPAAPSLHQLCMTQFHSHWRGKSTCSWASMAALGDYSSPGDQGRDEEWQGRRVMLRFLLLPSTVTGYG